MRSFGVIIKDFLLLRFTRRKQGSTAFAKPTINESPALPQWSIYRSADTCPWSIFKKILLGEPNSLLVILGDPTSDALNDAELTIYSTYCQLVGGVQIVALIKRSVVINALSSKIDRITTLLTIAQSIVDRHVCEELLKEGFTVDPDTDDNTYLKQISVANSMLKADIMRLQAMLAEKPKAKNGKQMETVESFATTLRELSKHQGYQVRENEITVLEYGILVQGLKAHIDHLDKLARTHGSGRKTQ